MDGYKPYSIHYGKSFYTIIVCGILLLTPGPWRPSLQNEYQTPAFYVGGNADAISAQPLPSYNIYSEAHKGILSDADRDLYHKIFNYQKAADWDMADKYISRLSNKLLLGDILAERYLHRHYNASSKEIFTWIENYSDHPRAYDMV